MDILLVMNPQNNYFSSQGSVYMGEKSDILKIRLVDFLSQFNKEKIFLRENHPMEDSFFINQKTHSVSSSIDYQVENSFKKYATIFLDKTRYNALYNTQLLEILNQKHIKHVGIVGVETHTSILFTAEDLRNRDFKVTVIEPCAMSYDDFLHSYAITILKNFLGVGVTNG